MKKKSDLKTEQDKWYKKLQKEGFNDVESDEDNLKVWSSIFFARHSLEQIQAKQAYYQMAENFLHEYKFASRRDEITWEYHSNGIGTRDITKILKKVRIKTNHVDVAKAIRRLKVIMYDMYLAPKKDYHE